MAETHFNNGDAISAAVLAGLGGYIVVEARQWAYMAEDGPGPGFFPIWYGIVLILLSLFVVGSRIFRMTRGEDTRAARATTASESARAKHRSEIYHALAVWAVFALSIAFLKVLGFLVAFGLLTVFIVAVIYRRPWKVALAVAFGTSLGFYLVFPLALSVALPVGVFGL